MAIRVKTSIDGTSDEYQVAEIHKRDFKSLRRRRSVKWVPLPAVSVDEAASVTAPKKKK